MTANLRVLGAAFVSFYRFSPRRQILLFFLMVIQGVTMGVGLLFIVPLLDLVGFDLGGSLDSRVAGFAQEVFYFIGVEPTLSGVLISYVIIVGMIASVRYRLATLSAETQFAYVGDLRDRLYRSLLAARWEFIVQRKMSDFSHCLTGQVQSIGQASNQMLSLLSQSVLASLMLVLAFLMSWKMTLLAIGFGGLLLGLLLPLNRSIYGSGRTHLANYKTVFQMLTEQLGSLKMIKSYSGESRCAERLRQTSENLENESIRVVRMNAVTQLIYVVGAAAAFSVFFYFSQIVFKIPIATLFLLLIIFSRLLPQFSGMQRSYQLLLHKTPAFQDVERMLSECAAAREAREETDLPPLELKQAINLSQISYRYPGKEEPVFEGLSACIRKNQTTALVGPSGVGKTTLADLLAGLLEPISGAIYCDEQLLEDSFLLSWRKSVAYVTQEAYLFHDTVRANLSWVVSRRIVDEDLWEVLRLAAAEDFVACLPEGLDTVVGDNGIRLSGGERQRLALARALLAEAQLLILDEATSALDAENEGKIQEALKRMRGQTTIVVIAHREATIADVDQRIHLQDYQPTIVAPE
ncbi:ABC transporter ATP-binding protein/permease [Puniceicoccaceae bacterium K14]|nr:ABC transporter ATP-binding protein/permease [Puniceicoccaceae bacterium K14]